MPNVKNINKVINAIRAAGTGEYEGLGFNMAAWHAGNGVFSDLSGHKCGSVACIAGWAWAVSSGGTKRIPYWPDNGYTAHGRDFFDISVQQARDLFTPDITDLDEITVDQAIETLEHLRDTGEVVWYIDETILEPE